MGQVSYHKVHMFYASSDKFRILSVKEAFFRILSRYISLRFQCFHNACIPLIPSLLWDHIRTRTDQIIQLDHVFPFRSPLSIQRIAFHSLNQRVAHLTEQKTIVCFAFVFLLLSVLRSVFAFIAKHIACMNLCTSDYFIACRIADFGPLCFSSFLIRK